LTKRTISLLTNSVRHLSGGCDRAVIHRDEFIEKPREKYGTGESADVWQARQKSILQIIL